MEKFDVIIVGAGPGGAACALQFFGTPLKILVLDKSAFPRDKICGDALSVDVVNQLGMISPELLNSFQNSVIKKSASGVQIFSPGGHQVDIPFIHKGKIRTGYICKRKDFDLFLYNELRSRNILIKENCEILEMTRDEDGIALKTNYGNFYGSFLIGADGANSQVKKIFFNSKIERNHHSAGLRQYFKGINGLHPNGFIELYFFKDILPGYLWIFPLENGEANVGIGVLSSEVQIKKLNLRKIFAQIIEENPNLQRRFAQATPLESVKGFGLPLGRTGRSIASDRVLLIGDAAGLIDPFSGEGIGNAIRSGRVAAMTISKCFEKNDFSNKSVVSYQEEIYRRMGYEFKVSRTLQYLCRFPVLFDFVVKKASKSFFVQNYLKDALSDVHQKGKLGNPLFYLKLLFKG